jgi:endonuclease/exonuclease/phosphatase family metal-dependent hydrolase
MKWRGVVILAAVGLALALLLGLCGGRPLRVGTFNIRRFGVEPTDIDRLVELVEALEADILAVQEIQSEPGLRHLERRLTREGRSFSHVLASCGGRSQMRVGFLFDTRRVALRATREYPELDPAGGGSCGDGDRAGLLGVFERGDETLHLLTMHLAHGGQADKAAHRKLQWQRAYAIVDTLRRAGAKSIAVLGDANSTGYLDDGHRERQFVDDAARNAGMAVMTRSLGCSEYWPERHNQLSPSLLDHVVATPGVTEEADVRVHGYCVELACRPHAAEPPHDYKRVSDHCPVTFDVR